MLREILTRFLMQIEISSEQFGTLGKKLGLVKTRVRWIEDVGDNGGGTGGRTMNQALDAELEQANFCCRTN